MILRTFLVAFSLGVVVVMAAAPATESTKQPTGPWIIAHRGASADAPENTLAAFKLAWQRGADGIEADFQLTRDGHVVCIHDKDTKRTGDRNLSVARSTLAQLRTVDVGRWKGETFKGERIPTMQQVLAVVPKGKRIFIELKDSKRIVEPVRRLIAASDLREDQITLISFDREVVAACRKAMPEITANWLIDCESRNGRLSPTMDEMLRARRKIDASGFGFKARRDVITAAFIERCAQADAPVHLWTVNDPKDAIHFQTLGVASITTDKPGEILRAMGR